MGGGGLKTKTNIALLSFRDPGIIINWLDSSTNSVIALKKAENFFDLH